MASKNWKRERAGLYSANLNGHEFQVEDMTTGYGDTGWFVWYDNGERSDYPRRTMREAIALAEREAGLN